MNNEFENNQPEIRVEPAEQTQQSVPETPADTRSAAPAPANDDMTDVFREEQPSYPNPFAPASAVQQPEVNTVPQGPSSAPQQHAAPASPYAPQPGYAPPYGCVPPYGYTPQGYAPQQGYAPPQGYVPPQSYAPPQGYAPSGQPNYGANYGYPPPQPPYYPPNRYGAYGAAKPPKAAKGAGKAGHVVMWITAILIEAIIVCFAIYGIYALCTDNNGQKEGLNNRPGYNQGQQGGNNLPSMPNRDDDTSSEIGENPTNVQMGIVCALMNETYAARYNLEVGLVVQSFASDSPAQSSGLQVGDVITSANGVRVKTFDELYALMQKMKPGDEMKLECYRLEETTENNWGFKAGEPFTVTFNVQEKHDEVSSYPGA